MCLCHDGKFELAPKYCGLPEFVYFWCIYNKFVFVKNRKLWPDKNEFAFALEKLTMELDEIW